MHSGESAGAISLTISTVSVKSESSTEATYRTAFFDHQLQVLQLGKLKPARRAEDIGFAVMIDDESNVFIRNPIQDRVHVFAEFFGCDMLHFGQ